MGSARANLHLQLLLWRVRWRGFWRRRRRPPPRRRLILALLVAVFFVVAGVTGILGDILRGVAEDQLSSLLDADVTIDDVSVHILPVGLTIEGVRVHSRRPGHAGSEVLWLGELSLRLAPSDPTEVIRVTSLRLDGLRAHINMEDFALVDLPGLQSLIDGSDEPPGEPTPTPEAKPRLSNPRPGPRLELGTVTVANVNAWVEDPPQGLKAHLAELNASASFGEGFNITSASLDIADVGATTPDLSEELRNISLRANGTDARITISRLMAEANGADVQIDGWVELPEGLLAPGKGGSSGPASANPSKTGADQGDEADPLAFLEGYRGQLEVRLGLDLSALNRVLADIPGLEGEVQLDASVAVEGPEVSGSGGLKLEEIAIIANETTYRVGSGALSLKGDRQLVEILDGSVTAGGGEVKLTAALELSEPGLPIQANVELGDVQLAQLLDDLGLTGSWVVLAIDGPAEVQGTLDPLELEGAVSLDTRRLRVYDASWERAAQLTPLLAVDQISLSGPLRIDGEGVYLDEALIASGSTRIFTDLTFGFDMALDIGLDIGQIDFDDIGPVVGLALEGHGWGKARVSGPIADMVIASQLSLFDARFEAYQLGDFSGAIVVPIKTMSWVERQRAQVQEGEGGSGVPGIPLSADGLAAAVAAIDEVNSAYYGDRYDAADELTAMLILDIEAQNQRTRYGGDVVVAFGDELMLWADADIPKGRLEDVLRMADVDLGQPPPMTGDLVGHVNVSGPLDALDGQTRGLVVKAADIYGEFVEHLEADVRLEGGDVHLDRARVEDGDGVIFGVGNLATDGAVALKLSLQNLSLADIEAVTDSDLPLTGAITSELTVLGSLDEPMIQGEILTSGVAWGTLDLGELELGLVTEGGLLTVKGKLGRAVALQAEVGMSGVMPFNALVEVQDLPLHAFIDLNDGGQNLDSGMAFSVLAAGSVTGDESIPLSVSARLDNLFIERGRLRIQNFGPGEIEVIDGGVEVRYLNLLGPDTNLHLAGTYKPNNGFDIAADGIVNLTIVDLLVADTFQRLGGKLTGPDGAAHLHLGGTLDAPVLSGVADVEGMAVRAVAFPQTVDGIAAHIEIVNNQVVVEDMVGTMGGGRLSGGGELRLGDDLFPTFYNLAFDAKEVVLRYPDYLPPSQIHGNLLFQGEVGNLLMSGRMVVDRSIYRERINWEKDLLNFRPNRLDSVALVDEGEPLFGFAIQIVADDTIYMRNNVGNLQISADLMFEGDTNLMGVSGDVEVTKGKVYLLNNELDVVEGLVTFPDYREFNPFMDLAFQTEIQGYNISYQIIGTLEDYQISSSSDSGLSERDINSLLAFGVLADELQGSSASAVAQPALEFLAGSLGLEQQVEGVVPIDLDRFGLTPVVSEDGSTSVRFYGEKEIKEDKINSSFHYDVGVRQNYNFTLEYRISEKLSAVGDADQGESVNTTGRIPNLGARFKLRWEWE